MCINDNEMIGSLDDALVLTPTPHFINVISACFFEAAGFNWQNSWQVSIYQNTVFIGKPQNNSNMTIIGDVQNVNQFGIIRGNVNMSNESNLGASQD